MSAAGVSESDNPQGGLSQVGGSVVSRELSACERPNRQEAFRKRKYNFYK